MKLLDMMIERDFNERMAQAEAQGTLVRMSKDAASDKDYDAAFLAGLLANLDQAYDADADSCY
jgi:hypothetical protein